MRRLSLICCALMTAALVLAAIGYDHARADPIVRRATIVLPDWPQGAAPVTVALVSDVHIGNAATDPARFARVAAQVTALRPDLIVLAGDFIAGHGSNDAKAAGGLAAGLRALRAPLGVIAVLGNHDHWTDPTMVQSALTANGVTVLTNDATRRGPLAIGGIDDIVTRHANLPTTMAAMQWVGGAHLLVSHSPDIAMDVARSDVAALLLAGHTHCGQIVLPLIGALASVSRFGERYACGLMRERALTVVVTSGIGTSMVPIRFGAPPDVWLLRLGG